MFVCVTLYINTAHTNNDIGHKAAALNRPILRNVYVYTYCTQYRIQNLVTLKPSLYVCRVVS